MSSLSKSGNYSSGNFGGVGSGNGGSGAFGASGGSGMSGGSGSSGTRKHSIDFLFVIVLLLFLMLTSVVMILLGTGVYKRVLASMSDNYDARTCQAYVLQKIRRGQTAGQVEAGELEGVSALLIHEEIADRPFVTYLYAYEGHLNELFTPEDSGLGLIAGSAILPLEDIQFDQLSDRAIRVSFTLEDGKSSAFLAHILPAVSGTDAAVASADAEEGAGSDAEGGAGADTASESGEGGTP